MVGELLNLCYEHETLLRDPVNWTRKAVAWAKGKTYDVPRLRPNVSTSSWGGRYMAAKPNPNPDPNPNPKLSRPHHHAAAALHRAAVGAAPHLGLDGRPAAG